MSIFGKAKKARENKKGFTLVELIVVLVILAILAAMLVPALLGWIDEARKKQYVLEARNVYMATQAYLDELYAAGEELPATSSKDTDDGYLGEDANERIAKISDALFGDIKITAYSKREGGAAGDQAEIAGMVIKQLTFAGADGTATHTLVTATLENGEWDITEEEPTVGGVLPDGKP